MMAANAARQASLFIFKFDTPALDQGPIDLCLYLYYTYWPRKVFF